MNRNIKKRLAKKLNTHELKVSVLSASSTPRLIEQVTEKVKELGSSIYALNPIEQNGRTRIELLTRNSPAKTYEEILFMQNAYLDTSSIYADVTVRSGYVFATVTYRATMPSEIRNLLKGTGNIKTNFGNSYESISCTI